MDNQTPLLELIKLIGETIFAMAMGVAIVGIIISVLLIIFGIAAIVVGIILIKKSKNKIDKTQKIFKIVSIILIPLGIIAIIFALSIFGGLAFALLGV